MSIRETLAWDRRLVKASGKLVGRAAILEEVWGSSEHPLTNIVEVYIRQLRRKVDQESSESLIQTVRGFGYKIRSRNDRSLQTAFSGRTGLQPSVRPCVRPPYQKSIARKILSKNRMNSVHLKHRPKTFQTKLRQKNHRLLVFY